MNLASAGFHPLILTTFLKLAPYNYPSFISFRWAMSQVAAVIKHWECISPEFLAPFPFLLHLAFLQLWDSSPLCLLFQSIIQTTENTFKILKDYPLFQYLFLSCVVLESSCLSHLQWQIWSYFKLKHYVLLVHKLLGSYTFRNTVSNWTLSLYEYFFSSFALAISTVLCSTDLPQFPYIFQF